MTDFFRFDDEEKETMADEVFYDEEKAGLDEVSEDDFDEEFDLDGQDSDVAKHGVTKAEYSGRDDDDEASEEFLKKTETSEDDFDDDFEEGADEETDKESEDDFENVCFICRRPESKTGKQFKMPNNICVCNDCMHKTMDAVSQFDYQGC